jgi:ubiquitin-like 1-activating enzyme E1 B
MARVRAHQDRRQSQLILVIRIASQSWVKTCSINLLKNLALIGIGEIEVIDLDTIDLSNLNRQFLFTKAHISKPKSLIASSTAGQFNPLVHITPYHANVKDTNQFGWEFFEKFDVVCNALDNLDARRWVNRMCIMTGIPLVESGTTGFLGQVQPIMKVRIEERGEKGGGNIICR